MGERDLDQGSDGVEEGTREERRSRAEKKIQSRRRILDDEQVEIEAALKGAIARRKDGHDKSPPGEQLRNFPPRILRGRQQGYGWWSC